MEEEEAPTGRVAAAEEGHQVETLLSSMMTKSSRSVELFVFISIESSFPHTYHLHANTS